MTTQDLSKGIDITAQTTVTGSEMNQLVDAGRTASDKGIQIETQDSALGVPTVPDPNATYIGINPTWWKRYLWKRRPFDSSGAVKTYQWFEDAVSDAIYLKWIDITSGLLTQTDLTTINTAISAAQTDATAALAQANLASAQALDAFSLAGDTNIALDAFKSFFGTEGQVPWDNITGKPENVSGVKYLNAHRLALDVNNAVAFVDTGWIFLDLTAYVDLFADSIALAPQLCTVIIAAKIETQLIGASAGNADAEVYFSNSNVAALADSRFISAKIKTTSPNDAMAVGQKELQVGLTGSKGIYYRWVSTGTLNDLKVYVCGFIDDVTKVA